MEQVRIYISIHAPRTGSDANFRADWHCAEGFQSTLPARGATETWRYARTRKKYFNPRSPHGERLSISRTMRTSTVISIHAPRTGSDQLLNRISDITGQFQSTLPARGATYGALKYVIEHKIFQSTLPARGATTLSGWSYNTLAFQSTLPARGATGSITTFSGSITFQSTLPARGATYTRCADFGLCWNFNPRSPHGERRQKL